MTHRNALRRHRNRGVGHAPGQGPPWASPEPPDGLQAGLVVPGMEVASARRGRWHGTREPIAPEPMVRAVVPGIEREDPSGMWLAIGDQKSTRYDKSKGCNGKT